MTDREKMIGQLKSIRDRHHFTATRVGAPGCRVRLEAADDLAALDWAIAELVGKR